MSSYANDALTEAFRDSYHLNAFDGRSVLEQSGVCEYARGDHAIYNYEGLATMGSPSEISSRNATSSAAAITTTNRVMITKVYYKEVVLDDIADIKEVIADPKSKLVQQFMNWFRFINDRDGIAAAAGSVNIGAPNTTATATTAANDGVITIDATAGITDTILNKIISTCINNEVGDSMIGSAFICTGTEQAQLLTLTTEINKMYSTSDGEKKNLVGRIRNMINVFSVAGSDAEITAARPRIAESGGVRYCPLILKGGLYSKFGIDKVVYTPDNVRYANSDTLKVIFRVGHVRTEGARVVLVKTTIETA